MTHLDEFTLNEYLDQALDEAAHHQAAVHLATCPTCQAALAELQGVFAALGQVQEMPLTADLAPRILPHLAPEQSPLWARLVLLAQAVGAAIMLGLLWSSVQETVQQTSLQLESAILQLFEQVLVQWQAVWAWGTAVFNQPPSFAITPDMITTQWLLLLGLALAAWVAGNRLLLKE